MKTKFRGSITKQFAPPSLIFLVAWLVRGHQDVAHGFSNANIFTHQTHKDTKQSLLYQQISSHQVQEKQEGSSHGSDDELCHYDAISGIISLFFSSTNKMYGNDDCAEVLIDKYFDPFIEYTDTALFKSIYGKKALLQNKKPAVLHLDNKHSNNNSSNQKQIIVEMVVSSHDINHEGMVTTICLMYTPRITSESTSSRRTENEKTKQKNHDASSKECETNLVGITFLTVKNGKVTRFFDVKGEISSLQPLVSYSNNDNNDDEEQTSFSSDVENDKMSFTDKINDDNNKTNDNGDCAKNIVSKYIKARNLSEMDNALNYVSSTCIMKYYSSASLHVGRQSILNHLLQMPKTSQKSIVIDDIFSSSPKRGQKHISVSVQWHLENDNGEIERFGRGSSLYVVNIADGKIVKAIELKEPAIKDEKSDAESIRTIIRPWLQNKIRDSGLGGFIADSLVKLSMPTIAAENTEVLSTFIDLTLRKKVIRYGHHSSQIMDVILPEDPNVRGVVFFVHGGAWGSGRPWIYRLVASPFLEKNMAVVIVGYRRYPESKCLDDQVDDLEKAFQCFKRFYPNYLKPRTSIDTKQWLGVSLVGHSSGAHISLLWLIRQLEQKFGRKNSEDFVQETLNFDTFTSLSGVFSISDHFYHEVGRGVDEISPMKAACEFTKKSFDYYSPTWKLQNTHPGTSFTTPMLFVHSLEDDVVPCTSTQKLVSALRQTGQTNISEVYLPDVDHVEMVTGLMLGGQSRKTVMEWVEGSTIITRGEKGV